MPTARLHASKHWLTATHAHFVALLGRIDSAFDDRNESVVESLIAKHPELYTLEMETFHLYVLRIASIIKFT